MLWYYRNPVSVLQLNIVKIIQQMRLLLILTAGFFFFLSISSIVLGVLALLRHVLQGLWLLAGGLVAQLIAITIALLAGISKPEQL